MAVDPAYKQVALIALANGGTAAKAALDDAKAKIDASKAAAVQNALVTSGKIGTSAAGQQELSDIISAPAASLGTQLATKRAAIGKSYDMTTPPTAAMFDAEANAAIAKSARGGRSGGGGGRRGGGGRGGGGSRSGKQSSSQWFYDAGLNVPFGSVSAGGLREFNKYVEETNPLKGNRIGALKSVGAPEPYAVSHFSKSPTWDDLVRDGAQRVADGTWTQKQYVNNLKVVARNARGSQGSQLTKKAHKAVKKAKKH